MSCCKYCSHYTEFFPALFPALFLRCRIIHIVKIEDLVCSWSSTAPPNEWGTDLVHFYTLPLHQDGGIYCIFTETNGACYKSYYWCLPCFGDCHVVCIWTNCGDGYRILVFIIYFSLIDQPLVAMQKPVMKVFLP